ncbi:MAG TPA: tetratricopeptide repeat protein [Candidatus Solibacter sp.]|nr:tetratricopeptide repeat protein [Candidatus Solibacter sp.]
MTWPINPSKEEIAFVMEAGMLYRDLRRYQEAREVFNGVRILAPTSDVPEVALGTVAFQNGDFERAGMHYRRALKLNPRSAWAYAHLGELALFEMDKEQARAHLNTAIDLDPRGDHGKLARALLDFADVVNFE